MWRSGQVVTDIPRGNLRPRRDKTPIDTTIPVVFQTLVLNTPELLHNITEYLTISNIKELVCVCRRFKDYWIPYIYSKVQVKISRRTQAYPNLHKYGDYIKDLTILFARKNDIIHILDFATNIQSLSIEAIVTKQDLSLIIPLVPQLRTLRLSLKETGYSSSILLASTLLNLEELTFEKTHWNQLGGHVRIDDLLHVIKSCTKLTTLTLSHIILLEDAPTSDDSVEYLKVDDEGWVSSSLRRLSCRRITLGPRLTNIDESEYPHACIRRLYQHLPNLVTIEHIEKFNFVASDWKFIFNDRPKVQNIEIFRPYSGHLYNRAPTPVTPFSGIELLNTLGGSCRNIKLLKVNGIRPTSDEGFATIARNNREIKIISACKTEFGDQALKELAHLPRPPTIPHTLVELHLDSCRNVSSYGISLVLENCSSLQCLNLSGTSAGTIDLFNSDKPWVCTKSLKLLCIDIQPIGWRPALPSNSPFNMNQPQPQPQTFDVARLTDDEEAIIRKRLYSFTSLVALELKGQAMSMNIIKDLSFAPNLLKIVIQILYKPVMPDTSNFRDVYQTASQHSEELGKELFKRWSTWREMSYAGSPGLFKCNLHATKLPSKWVKQLISTCHERESHFFKLI